MTKENEGNIKMYLKKIGYEDERWVEVVVSGINGVEHRANFSLMFTLGKMGLYISVSKLSVTGWTTVVRFPAGIFSVY
jgi:hypothetical protein